MNEESAKIGKNKSLKKNQTFVKNKIVNIFNLLI